MKFLAGKAKLFGAIFLALATVSVFLIILALAIASSTADYCVEAEEFDNDYVQVNSNPVADGVFGTVYDNLEGGQVATWHETGLRANGKPFLIQISGSWIPWYGSAMSDTKLQETKRCDFCAKKTNSPTENCICFNSQTPTREKGIDGLPLDVDCKVANNQKDPTKCSCTKQNGKVTDEGVRFFPLAYYNKDKSVKTADNQSSACKYDAGAGLYLGLFGTNSNMMPTRVYHLFSEATTCPINKNSDGECKDEDGVDQTKYIFRSANNKIFVKDDLSGNNGTNANLDDDLLHKPNEFVKLIIYDRYYADNYGKYSVTFLEGISRDGDTGLLEFLVSILEDAMLGKADESGVKKGGILEFMYKAIVQDSYFGAVLQTSLVLYIAFFGFATLVGIVEITRKELLSRLIKLSLVIFFTTPSSWYWYNQIVVGFFKDGMDVLIQMFSDYASGNLSKDNPILVAKSISTSPDGGASRFSYIDTMIKTLFSENVTKKIWGLFFESFFGFIYITALYALIFFFLYVMLLAAMVYMVTLMKLIFVLALGPIFIAFSLFGQTNAMFKNWLGFIGARSLEMVILFLILYTFVMLIDEKFVEMLHYRVCTHSVNFGLFSFGILIAETGRTFANWMRLLLAFGGLTFILMQILNKIPYLAGNLISIDGVGNKDSDSGVGNNQSAVSMASSMLGAASGLATSALKTGLTEGGGRVFRALRFASRHSGVSGVIDKISSVIPIRGVRTRLRDNIIDNAVALGKKSATQKGLTPGTKAFDNEVRNFAMNDKKSGILAFQHSNKKKAALYDFDRKSIDKRLDTKLVEEPLKQFIKDEAKRIKEGNPSKIPLGRDMQEHLKSKARDWADKNLSGGANSISDHLTDLKGFMKSKGKLSDDEAAKKFAGNDDLKNRYLQYKQERAFEKGKKPTSNTGKNFIRKAGYEEKRGGNWRDAIGLHTGKGWNPLKRIGWADKLLNRDSFNEQTRAAMEKMAANYLKNGGSEDEKSRLHAEYREKAKGVENTFYGRQLLGQEIDQKDKNGNLIRDRDGNPIKIHKDGKLDKELKAIDAKREFFRQALLDKLLKDVTNSKEGKTEDELDKMRADALTEVAEMREKQLSAIANADWSYLQANGGVDAARDGLTNFDGNSLLEAQARAKLLGATDTEIAETSSATTSAISATDPIGTIGLQPSDLGLQAGNILLADNHKKNVNDALISMRESMKINASRDVRAKKQGLAVKEQEIADFEKKASDAKNSGDFAAQAEFEAKARAAKSEAADLDKELRQAERQVENFEKDIESIRKS